MPVSCFTLLLGRVPVTAWRAASKAPSSGAKVAGGVAKARASGWVAALVPGSGAQELRSCLSG